MKKNIINYSGGINSDINSYYFVQGEHKELFLIHEFDSGNLRDYLVIGKVNPDSLNAAGPKLREWLVMAGKLINSHQRDGISRKFNNFDYEKFYENGLTQEMLFTREGYDLIYNKFLYTNYEIERTIEMQVLRKKDRILYDLQGRNSSYYQGSNEEFYTINDLEENYYFSNRELVSIDKMDFTRYIIANPKKVNKLILTNQGLLQQYTSFTSPHEKINFLMQIVSFKTVESKVEEKSGMTR